MGPGGNAAFRTKEPHRKSDAPGANLLRLVGRKDSDVVLQLGASSLAPLAAENDELPRIVTDHLPARVAYIDRDLRYRLVNGEYARGYGLSPEHTVGRTVRELQGDIAYAVSEPILRRALSGETILYEGNIDQPSGEVRVTSHFIPDRDAAGEIRGVVVFATDVTEQRRTEAVLAKESARLLELFDKAPAFTALMEGSELAFTFVNEAYLKLVSYRNVVGIPVRKVFPELAGRGYFELLDHVVETGLPFIAKEMTMMLQNPRTDELQRHYVDVLYQAMLNADDAVAGVFVHGVDVTDRVVARKEIAEREELFRTVFEQASDDAMVLIDADRTITGWNPAAENICGWTEAEAVGQPIDMIFTAADRATGGGAGDAAEAARSGRAVDERWHVRKNGERFWGSGTINPLHHLDGSVRGFLKVFRDATDRHNLSQKIDELNEALETKVADRTRDLQQAVREAESFNYSISHDLRTPLRAMVSTSMIVLEEAGPELGMLHRELLERQAHNAVRLGEMIDGLLQLSRYSRVELKRRTVDMTMLAKSVATEASEGCDVNVQEGMTSLADPTLVRTVFQNLIGNACKFSPNGGSVEVGETEETFWVRDDGVGFDMKYAAKIFTAFERLVSDSEFPGTGIGLANVERIVKRHGGRVWAESMPGKGSTFFFTLAAA